MKKFLAILLILFISFSLFAKGKSESSEQKKTEENLYRVHILEETANAIAQIFDRLSLRLSLAISPFPSVTSKFFKVEENQIVEEDENQIGNFQDNHWLLTDDETYENNTLNPDYDTYLDNPDRQRTRWNLIFWLIVSFTVMECLYIVVFPHGNREENLDVRLIIIKMLQSFLVVLLLAGLPYLVEVSKYGLCKIVNVFSKDNLSDQLDFTFPTMAGSFVRKMAALMKYIDPSTNGIDSGVSILEIKMTTGFVGKTLVKLVYIIFEFFMFLLVFRTGVQIVCTVVRTYIVMMLSMITLPFSIFSPIKSVGEKSVLALVANLVECFIIAILIATAIPVINRITQPLISASAVDPKEPYVWNAKLTKIDSIEGPTIDSLESYSDYTLQTILDDSGISVLVIHGGNILSTGHLFDKYVFSYGNYEGTEKEKIAENRKGVISAKPQSIDLNQATLTDTQNKEFANLYKIVQHSFKKALTDIAKQMNSKKINPGIADLETAANAITKNVGENNGYQLRGSFAKLFVQYFTSELDAMLTESDLIMDKTFSGDLMIVRHLVFCFLAIFLPCHFVNQSSMLANMLMSGSVGRDNASDEIARGLMRTSGTFAAGLSIFSNAARLLTRNRSPQGQDGSDAGSAAKNIDDSPQSNAQQNLGD